MRDAEDRLNTLFREYQDACPTPEPGVAFMPELWARIESRRNFAFVFTHCARMGAAAAALVCALLLVLTLITEPHVPTAPLPTYADALAADQTAEKTYYVEAVRNTPDYSSRNVDTDVPR